MDTLEERRKKEIRKKALEERKKELLKHKKKIKEGYELRDVEGKVISREGKPHSTYEGKMAERRKGYIRKTEKWDKQVAAESESKNRRTHIGTIRKKYSNEHPKYK